MDDLSAWGKKKKKSVLNHNENKNNKRDKDKQIVFVKSFKTTQFIHIQKIHLQCYRKTKRIRCTISAIQQRERDVGKLSGSRGWSEDRKGRGRRKGRRSEGEMAEDEETNPPRKWQRNLVKHMLQYSPQQHRVLLQHLSHYCHQYHPSN